MSYRLEKIEGGEQSLIIDGFEKGIASSPYLGIANIRNLNTSYYPGVAYTNYRRQAATISGTWYAGTHSTNVSGNSGWIFSASGSMGNPVQKATSPAGLNYILDDTGNIFKQSAVNSSTFTILGGGTGRFASGNKGLAYWNNYLVVFGAGVIEFCGKGTNDADIISTNWNLNNSGAAHNTAVFSTNFAVNNRLTLTVSPNLPPGMPRLVVNDPVTFTTTGTLPAGLSLATTYYIISIDQSGSQYITVSATVGGASVTLTSDGTGTHTLTDNSTPIPLGNVTSVTLTLVYPIVGATTLTLSSYVSPTGLAVNGNWQGATGLYDIVMQDGQKVPANFTNGSATINLVAPLVYIAFGSSWQIQLIDPTVTDYRPYVSKVDGSLYFCNGSSLGRISGSSTVSISTNPGLASSYSVNVRATRIPITTGESVVDMTDLKNQLVIASTKNIYTWDYLSANVIAPSPVGESVSRIVNLLNNIYILAGQKGNIYISNGYSAQLLFKMPDFIAGLIDPVWSWGDAIARRSRLIFQALLQNTSGVNQLAGIFSLTVSPSMLGETASGLIMEAQNSYGLTPASGALSNGLLIDNSPSANGNDSYYSAWSNGAITGGIDYNDTTLWQNFEPTIETDIIPIGTILDKKTFGNIEFKLDRPMISGDQIRIYWRPSLTDSYVLMGTTTSAQLSDYYPSNISQVQWIQFKIQMKCASSGSSFIPLREIRLHFN